MQRRVFLNKQDAQTAQSHVHAPSMINKLLRPKYEKLATAALKSSVEGWNAVAWNNLSTGIQRQVPLCLLPWSRHRGSVHARWRRVESSPAAAAESPRVALVAITAIEPASPHRFLQLGAPQKNSRRKGPAARAPSRDSLPWLAAPCFAILIIWTGFEARGSSSGAELSLLLHAFDWLVRPSSGREYFGFIDFHAGLVRLL